MKKLYQFCKSNPLFLLTLALLVFIPLYPKLPLVDIKHTWVYVRIEDFMVLFVLFFWGILVARGAISLATPLTVPILLFWSIGAVATIHGVLLIFPNLADTYPNVAFLSFLRRIEYMSLFFVAYKSMKDKRLLPLVAIVLMVTVFAVTLYGIGQKYMGFPAFLTMNEEFAKGVPIRLSQLSRVSSTFSGHYDLAAYLVLIIPILVSMVFGFRNLLVRASFLTSALLGLVVLFMTVSRISLFALFLSLGLVLFVQKKKFVIVSFFIIALGTLILASASPSIVDRFGSTLKEIDVLVDATTGEAVGHSKIVPNTYFSEKTVKQVFANSIGNIYAHASPSAAFVIPYTMLEENVVLYREPNAPTGESLPQGTGYINLSLSPVTRRLGYFYYEPIPKVATTSAEVFIINGDFLIKKVLAYDLSFTTRFQGEWPRAIDAFRRNILVGSGYGSVGLAVDNSYLRMLGEVGLLGFGAFLAIFLLSGIYIRKMIPDVDNYEVRSFIIGFIAGVMGIAINALFIDVFEASKVAFVLWLLFGITLGTLRLYGRRLPDLYKPLKTIITSPIAVVIFLFILTVVLYSSMIRNNFVGDDFTWFRWVADCGVNTAGSQRCNVNISTIVRYFTQADGFFYRPGAKLYFLLMYSVFWLNQSVYHAVSLALHFIVSVLVFFLARKILKNFLLSAATGVMFLLLSGLSESVFWISATGFLFTACFSLASFLCFTRWEETEKKIYFVTTLGFFILSLLFHELGIVTPILYLLYTFVSTGTSGLRRLLGATRGIWLLAPIPVYFIIRYLAHSHWLSGDYNYNFFKLPFNAMGNAVGYFFLTFFGPYAVPAIGVLRGGLRSHVVLAIGVTFMICTTLVILYKAYFKHIEKEDRRIVSFTLGFFIITLLPFLGLGNMTSRYSYLSTVGLVILFVYALKKLYMFLLVNGRIISILVVTIIGSIFGLLQIIQIQQIHSDWYEAGEKSRRFIVSIDGAYQDYWGIEPIELHFVNVPIRIGEAWVFPVGIADALWLIFRNPNIRVFTWPSVSAAFNAIDYDSKNQKVFEFTPTGKLIEHRKTRNIQ
ncbi:hypothetical protein HY409_01205 [Candidatus Gottesmanbacteria bacterium]|nr:hypothetical protein [Candidatus Gottesmanbacteria bacterium]